MQTLKISSVGRLFVLFFIIVAYTQAAQAKSIYVITEHHASTLSAYEIQGDKIKHQGNVAIPNLDYGAVGVTIDSQLKMLFITYEGKPSVTMATIVWADAVTLEKKGDIDLSVHVFIGGQFAGIVADEAKQRVYTVVRRKNFDFIGVFLQS